jgi:uncharacterized membrane protein
MGPALAVLGRFLTTMLSGLGFFSLFGVTDKDRNETPFYIVIAVLSTLLGYLVLKRK